MQRMDVMSSVSSQHRDQLKNIKTVLENMVGFVEVLTGEIGREEKEHEVMMAGRKNKENWRKIEEYEGVGRATKTLFVVADLLEHIDLPGKIRTMLRGIAAQKDEAVSHWREGKNSSSSEEPALCYEYFDGFDHLIRGHPDITEVVHHMLCIRTDFFEASMIYQALLAEPAPHLNSTYTRLISYLQHIPLYPRQPHLTNEDPQSISTQHE